MSRVLAILLAVSSIMIIPLVWGVPPGALFQFGPPLIFLSAVSAGLLLAWPLPLLSKSFKDGFESFAEKESLPQELAQEILWIATLARKEGILQVEAQRSKIQDENFRQAVKHVVDGLTVEQLKELLKVESAESAPSDAVQVLRYTIRAVWMAAGLATLFGISKSLSMYSKVLSTDILPFVLAIAFHLFLLLPMAQRLEKKFRDRWVRKRMILQGVVGIAEGVAPLALEDRLQSLIG